MKKVYFMLADGFEETEFTAPWDLLLRAGAEVTVFSVSGNEYVTGAHGLTVKADKSISVPDADCDLIVLPGGAKERRISPHRRKLPPPSERYMQTAALSRRSVPHRPFSPLWDSLTE